VRLNDKRSYYKTASWQALLVSPDQTALIVLMVGFAFTVCLLVACCKTISNDRRGRAHCLFFSNSAFLAGVEYFALVDLHFLPSLANVSVNSSIASATLLFFLQSGTTGSYFTYIL